MCASTERAEVLLASERTSPAEARAFARASGCAEHELGLLDDALLLISELVTNAVVHGGQPIVLAIECDGEGLQVRVRDGSPEHPHVARRGDAAESGRGMGLVDLLASDWGVDTVDDAHGTGKETWFELRPR